MKTLNIIGIVVVLLCNYMLPQWQSSIVYYNGNNRLVYMPDSEGNKVPDFSYAGYKNSNVEIPSGIPAVKMLAPIQGDNTAHIQAAIDSIALMPLQSNGFRGALLLTKGLYNVSGTIKINASGIVLRGEGDGADAANSTIIYGTGNAPIHRTVVIAGGGSINYWSGEVSGTRTLISSDTVYAGDRVLYVENATAYSVGDNIIIYHPCTDQWLQKINYGEVHQGEFGSDSLDVPWEVNSQPIIFNRVITNISGNRITIDAPVFNHLVKTESPSYIYKYDRAGLLTNIGIENLRIDIETAGGLDENHAWQALDLCQVEDAWVKNCTFIHFGQSGIRTLNATRITVDSCRALDPVSEITGERRYNFQLAEGSQLILFRNCYSSNGRHDYMSNGASTVSGCVFLDCISTGAYAPSEGHRRWSQGLLYDNLKELTGPRPTYEPRLLCLYNRGFEGTGHGWSAVHSVAWNCDVNTGALIVQKPPTGQNYALGCKGAVTGLYPLALFVEPQGFIEGTDQQNINPRSLFIAQLADRLNSSGVQDNRITKVNEFVLEQNYPNPFNPVTKIRYYVPVTGRVELNVYNIMGEKVAVLCNVVKNTGYYEIEFSGKNLASGVYLYELAAGGTRMCRKMILLK